MKRFISDPLAVPPPGEGYAWSSAELIVYGVDHLGPSYEVRVFLEAPDADVTTPLTPETGYAGGFTVFGHGGCFGDDGHCDPADRYVDEYDVRLPHQSLPQTKVVDVTAALHEMQACRTRACPRRRSWTSRPRCTRCRATPCASPSWRWSPARTAGRG